MALVETLSYARKPHHVYIEHLRIPVGAGSLHAERVGRGGRPIVLVHGFGTCAFLWRAVAPRLAEVGFTVTSLDLLGYGESDRPDDANYSLTAQAEYLDRALTVLRLPRATLVGQDMGALVAMQLGCRHPERLERLAILNPPDLNELPGPEIRALQRSSAKGALNASSLFSVSPMLGPLLRDSVVVPSHMPDLLVARYVAPFVGQGGVEHLLMLASAVEFENDDLPSPSSIRRPVLFIRGDQDRWTDPGVVSRMSALIPGSRIASMPGVGRLVAEDSPDGLARLLTEWISDSTVARLDDLDDDSEAAGTGGIGGARSTEESPSAS